MKQQQQQQSSTLYYNTTNNTTTKNNNQFKYFIKHIIKTNKKRNHSIEYIN